MDEALVRKKTQDAICNVVQDNDEKIQSFARGFFMRYKTRCVWKIKMVQDQLMQGPNIRIITSLFYFFCFWNLFFSVPATCFIIRIMLSMFLHYLLNPFAIHCQFLLEFLLCCEFAYFSLDSAPVAKERMLRNNPITIRLRERSSSI